MAETFDLDHTSSANGRIWAETVDPTVNRLSLINLGRLTNIGGTANAIEGRLSLSTGFTAIADNSEFLLVPAANNTGAVTLQLKDSSGASNLGAAFALRDVAGVAFPANALIAGRLYRFHYNASEGYARRVGEDNPYTPPSIVSGWTLLEKLEPTNDGTTAVFATDISGYKMVRIEIVVQVKTSGATMSLQYSPDGSTWRTIGISPAAPAIDSVVMAVWEISNVNRSDGSDMRVAALVSAGLRAGVLDRSSAVSTILAGGTFSHGLTTFAELMSFIRISLSAGNYEASDADQRSIFKLWGMS